MVEESARPWRILPALVAGVLYVSGGCRKGQEPIPGGSFRAVAEDVVDDDLLLVKRITITASGRRSVGISEKGGLDRIWGDPDPTTGLMTVQVVIAADPIKPQPASGNLLRWLVRMTTGGATVGGPGLSPAGSARSLKDLVAIQLDPGYYSLSQNTNFGHVQGRQLVLTVRETVTPSV